MTDTHVYSDLSRRRLVDLCVQRATLLSASAAALENLALAERQVIARQIRKHLREVDQAAGLRRGVRVDEGAR